jgi:hypothetical protein
MVLITTMFGDLNYLSASFLPAVWSVQVLSSIAFIGGFLVMLWYAYLAWTKGWRWPGKVWSILLVLSAAMVLYIALVFKLISLTTNY